MAGGYSLAHAMMMLIPEAWDHDTTIDPAKKAFYEGMARDLPFNPRAHLGR
mgnify:CR=1 FL=1